MDFWELHGWLFLVGIVVFPRLTMVIAGTVFKFMAFGMSLLGNPLFGILLWLGWVFIPYVLVAILATIFYWETNPVLCAISWLVAFFGTKVEGSLFSRREVIVKHVYVRG